MFLHDVDLPRDRVHFHFRVEYAVDGRGRHEDVEVLTPHYRGSRAEVTLREGPA